MSVSTALFLIPASILRPVTTYPTLLMISSCNSKKKLSQELTNSFSSPNTTTSNNVRGLHTDPLCAATKSNTLRVL
ncbi:hypothetical protein E2C01_007359 [Portunus trituberculatus]|uniref:Secreted protein n=1 Tax=Portunus trituberculatus TaxID=210409 RepID=A0A5B7CXZ9_PORTR|nr:hypothetical protein [Portunus trituberculatus]